MHYLLLLGLIIIVIYGPQLWVQYVLSRYNRKEEPNFPGNGGELARHILNKYQLEEVKVEVTDQGDHYDPDARAVRLTRDKLEGRTLTAITVAAHECGHALQHAAGEPLFITRTRIARSAIWAQRLGSFLLFAAPVVEIDASFNKALPILESGYLDERQKPAARRILKAAAWTYVAASLATLLNFWRWLAVLRR